MPVEYDSETPLFFLHREALTPEQAITLGQRLVAWGLANR